MIYLAEYRSVVTMDNQDEVLCSWDTDITLYKTRTGFNERQVAGAHHDSLQTAIEVCWRDGRLVFRHRTGSDDKRGQTDDE